MARRMPFLYLLNGEVRGRTSRYWIACRRRKFWHFAATWLISSWLYEFLWVKNSVPTSFVQKNSIFAKAGFATIAANASRESWTLFFVYPAISQPLICWKSLLQKFAAKPLNHLQLVLIALLICRSANSCWPPLSKFLSYAIKNSDSDFFHEGACPAEAALAIQSFDFSTLGFIQDIFSSRQGRDAESHLMKLEFYFSSLFSCFLTQRSLIFSKFCRIEI